MENNSNPEGFVSAVIERIKKDTGYRAVMSRADNPAFESAVWEHLIPYCNIENDYERIPFAVIGAAIARIRPEANGQSKLGEAFRGICKNEDDREREGRRFRRLISCESSLELCTLLRPVLQYLASNGAAFDYAALLKDVLYWNRKTRLAWTVQFYGKIASGEEEAES